MARKRFDQMNCVVARSLDQIGDWWTLLIVREAMYGTRTFSKFERRLGIAKNILADRLARLVEQGVMRREVVGRGSKKGDYLLTEKGADLLTVLVALTQWGDRWVAGAGQEPMRLLDRAHDRPIAPLRVTSADHAALAYTDLRFVPGPGASGETVARFAPPDAPDD